MNPVACNFCGSSTARPRYSLKDWLTRRPGEFALVECPDCGLLYLNPQPTWQELEPFYPDTYHSYRASQPGQGKGILERIKNVGWQRRRRLIAERRSGGRLLDVGCATGEFLAEMETQGAWETYGVEPVAFAAGVALANTKAQIFEGTLEAARYPDDFFDVVTLWDVLEHIPDPASVIREARRILKPGGMLVIRVPDPESPSARWFGRAWLAWDAPRHLYHFPKSIFTRRLHQENFTGMTTCSITSEHFVFFGSLAILAYSKGWNRLGARLETISNSTGWRALLAPIFLPLRRLGVGSSPVYFAWKASAAALKPQEG